MSMIILLWIAIGVSVLIFMGCWVLVFKVKVTFVRILSALGIVITTGAGLFFIWALILQYAFYGQ